MEEAESELYADILQIVETMGWPMEFPRAEEWAKFVDQMNLRKRGWHKVYTKIGRFGVDKSRFQGEREKVVIEAPEGPRPPGLKPNTELDTEDFLAP